jgi:hypothetical protein
MECFVLLGGGLWGPSSSSSEVDPGGASRFLGAGPPVEVLAVDFVRAIAVKRQEIHACVDRRNQSDAYIRAELFRIPDFSHNTISQFHFFVLLFECWRPSLTRISLCSTSLVLKLVLLPTPSWIRIAVPKRKLCIGLSLSSMPSLDSHVFRLKLPEVEHIW